jgi:hypothetical protein
MIDSMSVQALRGSRLHIVTFMPNAKQRLGKHIPATHAQATIGHLLLGNGAVNTFRQHTVGVFRVVLAKRL